MANSENFIRRSGRGSRACAAAILLATLSAPTIAHAGECPGSGSEIATDRPDVTNSSLVVPAGSLQSENGINTTGRRSVRTFDGTNSRLRLGIAPCLEFLVDIPDYFGRLKGDADSGFGNVAPAVKWQFSSLPEAWNASVAAGAGLPTGSTKITGPGLQPYLQLPWSYEFGGGWGTSGMLTSFFFPVRPRQQADHGGDLRARKEGHRARLAVRRICR